MAEAYFDDNRPHVIYKAGISRAFRPKEREADANTHVNILNELVDLITTYASSDLYKMLLENYRLAHDSLESQHPEWQPKAIFATTESDGTNPLPKKPVPPEFLDSLYRTSESDDYDRILENIVKIRFIHCGTMVWPYLIALVFEEEAYQELFNNETLISEFARVFEDAGKKLKEPQRLAVVVYLDTAPPGKPPNMPVLCFCCGYEEQFRNYLIDAVESECDVDFESDWVNPLQPADVATLNHILLRKIKPLEVEKKRANKPKGLDEGSAGPGSIPMSDEAVAALKKRANELKGLHAGWAGPGSLPVSDDAVTVLNEVVAEWGPDIPRPSIDSSGSGDLVLEWRNDDRQAVVDIDSLGEIGYAYKQQGKWIVGETNWLNAREGMPDDLKIFLREFCAKLK